MRICSRQAEKQALLSAQYIRERIAFDPASGAFVWRSKPVADVHYDVIWNTRYAGRTAGVVNFHGYITLTIDGRKFLGHRIAWLHHYGEWPNGHIDHIDGDRANNSIGNLRLATPSENGWNRKGHSRNTSGFKGVCWDKSRNKWIATIMAHGKMKSIGRYDTAEKAAAAYAEAAARLHGKFATTY